LLTFVTENIVRMIRFIFLAPLIIIAFSFMEKQESISTVQHSPVAVPVHESDDTLKINELVFADFFSPNGDGYNDKYIILNVENYPLGHLKVFNRWGELVYHAAPYKNDWDGKTNQSNSLLGAECTPGVYYFEYFDGIGNRASGKITLKR
jgi:gliding motility-associated-like protein